MITGFLNNIDFNTVLGILIFVGLCLVFFFLYRFFEFLSKNPHNYHFPSIYGSGLISVGVHQYKPVSKLNFNVNIDGNIEQVKLQKLYELEEQNKFIKARLQIFEVLVFLNNYYRTIEIYRYMKDSPYYPFGQAFIHSFLPFLLRKKYKSPVEPKFFMKYDIYDVIFRWLKHIENYENCNENSRLNKILRTLIIKNTDSKLNSILTSLSYDDDIKKLLGYSINEIQSHMNGEEVSQTIDVLDRIYELMYSSFGLKLPHTYYQPYLKLDDYENLFLKTYNKYWIELYFSN